MTTLVPRLTVCLDSNADLNLSDDRRCLTLAVGTTTDGNEA